MTNCKLQQKTSSTRSTPCSLSAEYQWHTSLQSSLLFSQWDDEWNVLTAWWMVKWWCLEFTGLTTLTYIKSLKNEKKPLGIMGFSNLYKSGISNIFRHAPVPGRSMFSAHCAQLYMAQLYIDRESAVSAAWVPSLWKPCGPWTGQKKTWSMGLIMVDISIVDVIYVYIYISYINLSTCLTIISCTNLVGYPQS